MDQRKKKLFESKHLLIQPLINDSVLFSIKRDIDNSPFHSFIILTKNSIKKKKSLPTTQITYRLTSKSGPKAIKRFEESLNTELDAYEVLIKIKAIAFNYRGLIITTGEYALEVNDGIIPTSGASEQLVRFVHVKKLGMLIAMVFGFSGEQVHETYASLEIGKVAIRID